MTSILGEDANDLRAALVGELLTPHSSDYEDLRRVWNADVDRRPALICRCESDADVVAAVTFARATGLEVAVRAGAHSVAGDSTVDGGMVIDLRRMNGIQVDPVAKRARVGGGALLAELDAATQQHGLAVPAGLISHTGVAGLTLGGGMGWLTRQAGLTIDNLEAARVVTADGRVLRATVDEHPDLFWAIRGGGGNFGAVTEFEFRLHEVGPTVQYGLLFFGLDQGAEMFRLARHLLADLPRRFNLMLAALSAPPEPFVPERYHHQPGYAMLLAGFGAEAHAAAEHAQLVARITEQLPPLFQMVTPMRYVDLQQLSDEAVAWGSYCYEKGAYFQELSDAVIEVILKQWPRRASPGSQLLVYRLDGAFCDVADSDSAFGGVRRPHFATFLTAVCDEQEQLASERQWVRSCWQALQPHSVGIGSYVNAMGEFEEDRVRAAYGEKYPRLAELKAKYDPRNLFRRNSNIVPG